MSQIPTNEDITKIHSAYKALTGVEAELTMTARFIWEAFLVRYSEPDLACTIRYLKMRIKEKRREVESLGMRNLVANLDYFAETLAMARAEMRNSRTETPRESILRATGRPTQPEKPAQPVNQILERTKLAAALKEWREANL